MGFAKVENCYNKYIVKNGTLVRYLFVKSSLKMHEMLFQNFPLVQVTGSPSLSHFKTSTLECLQQSFSELQSLR